MKNCFLVFLLFSCSLISHGQNVNPNADEIFREDEIARVEITMTEADKEFLLDDANASSNEYLHAQFRFVNSLMDTTLGFDVGIRLRGNTSRGAAKSSFKIDFREYEGAKFFDHKKFNLKAEVNDPSMVREFLTMQTFRKAGVPAARTHFAEVYLNEEYMGLYVNVEQIDDEFVQARFDYDEGNLFKCSWGSTLEDDGQVFDNDRYELKTNEELNDRSRLLNFVDVLNNTSSADFEQELEKIFNVNSFITYLAVEALTGHWDGYSFLKNNFYLYENETGKIEFIVYDTDNTFGIDWLGEDWGTRDIMNWANTNELRPLTTRVLERVNYRNLYKLKLRELLDGDFSEDYFFPEISRVQGMISNSVFEDTFYPQGFGFSFTDFNNSSTQAVANHAPYGLQSYISTRILFAEDQLGEIVAGLGDDKLHQLSVFPNPTNGNKLTLHSDRVIDTIVLTDIHGKQLNFTNTFYDSEYHLSFTLNPGVYFLKLNQQVRKFVVD